MFPDWTNYHSHLADLEQKGFVKRTFRRLDPQRQRAILEAILNEAADKGPAALGMKAVAQRAGVAVGSLYQYFPNRSGLLEFAIELCVCYMTDLFDLSAPYLLEMPFMQAFHAYLSYGVEWGRSESGLVRFFGRAAYQGDPVLIRKVVEPVALKMRLMLRDLLAQAVKRGEIRADFDLEAAARILHALTIVMGDSQLLPYLNSYFQVTDKDTSFEHVLDELVLLIGRGLEIHRENPE